MNVLGISYGFGDPSACLLVDGRVVIAVVERQLRDEVALSDFPAQAIARCLHEAGLGPEELDRIAVAMRPTHWSERARHALTQPRSAMMAMRVQVRGARRRGDALLDWLRAHYRPFRWPRIDLIDPVRALAEGSFLASGMPEAAILCLHGGVEWHTDYLGAGGPDGCRIFHQSSFPHSFGLFAESIAAFCGFGAVDGIGRMAGLACTGDPKVHQDILSDVLLVDRAGRVTLDLSFFAARALVDPRPRVARPYAHKLAQTFGRPRAPGGALLSHHRDVAAAAQHVLEARVLSLAEALHQRSGKSRLVFCGDLATNASLNGRLLRDGPFEELYVMPAPGRRGQALAAAMVAGRGEPLGVHALFLGPRYDDGRQWRAIRTAGLHAERNDVIRRAAELLVAGKTVAWFDGAAEHGPAPLGHRSIFRAVGAGNDVLHRAKGRVAPTPPVLTLPEHVAAQYLEVPRSCASADLVVDVRPSFQQAWGPRVRVQTVTPQATPRLAQLLDAVGASTGQPVLWHTSFNRTGEPPVETPEQALACYPDLGVDALVLGASLVTGRAS